MVHNRKIRLTFNIVILFAVSILICIAGNYTWITNYSTHPSRKHNSYAAGIARSSLVHPSAYETKPVFIFLHAPKTGGSFIRVVLQHWCIATNKLCLQVASADQYGDIREHQEMSAWELNKIDVFFGHIPYGVHEILKLRRPIKYLTILRDPVQQAISAFHFQRYQYHYLSGAFALQSVIRQLNNTFHSRPTSFNYTTKKFQLGHDRNDVISHLTKKDTTLRNEKRCFSSFGGSEAWTRVHNFSIQRLQSMNTLSLLNFAYEVVNHAWQSNCTRPPSPEIMMSFSQFLRTNLDLNSTWKEYRPQWDFGNNPTTTLFCCYHLWSSIILEKFNKEQYVKCPRIRNDETLNCALDNMNQIDLILITEKMELSLRLLEIFLNWTIPTELKQLRINEAVYVTPLPPPIRSQDLIVCEKLANLDRIIYQTALLKFWADVHSNNILSSTL